MSILLLVLLDIQTFLLGVLVGVVASQVLKTSQKRKELQEMRHIIEAIQKAGDGENRAVRSPIQIKKKD